MKKIEHKILMAICEMILCYPFLYGSEVLSYLCFLKYSGAHLSFL